LGRLYDSLASQSRKDFRWLVIDDGSTDRTESLLHNISKHAEFPVDYVKKINGGKHTAINTGIEMIESPLTFVVDSDDCLTEDAIEIIWQKWEAIKTRPYIGSIWFLQSDFNGNLVGDPFPMVEFVSNYVDVIVNSGIRGDKRAVYLTQYRKKFPFPVIDGEKFIGEGIIHKRISTQSQALFVNRIIYRGEYIRFGLTDGGRALRIKNPLGCMLYSQEFFSKDVIFRIRLKRAILYIVYSMFAGKTLQKVIKDSGIPVLATMATPLAFVLHIYWRLCYRLKLNFRDSTEQSQKGQNSL
jgi:glycosyltransferase involved in cell wall biosynthesis